MTAVIFGSNTEFVKQNFGTDTECRAPGARLQYRTMRKARKTAASKTASPIYRRIAERLEAIGMSESAASMEAVGSLDYIRNLRRNPTQVPNFAKAKALAKVLRCNVHWLLTGEGSPDTISANRPSIDEQLAEFPEEAREELYGFFQYKIDARKKELGIGAGHFSQGVLATDPEVKPHPAARHVAGKHRGDG